MDCTEFYSYPLVEDFGSLQGEGAHCGLGAYFLRLGGCDVGCLWCDSPAALSAAGAEVVGTEEILRRVLESNSKSVVITGGEPTLHNLSALTTALHTAGIEIWLETSGTNPLVGRVDWITLSPKPWMPPLAEYYDVASEIKVVVGSEADLAFAQRCAAQATNSPLLYLQAQWDLRQSAGPLIMEYIKAHPQWRLSVQTHKYFGID